MTVYELLRILKACIRENREFVNYNIVDVHTVVLDDNFDVHLTEKVMKLTNVRKELNSFEDDDYE